MLQDVEVAGMSLRSNLIVETRGSNTRYHIRKQASEERMYEYSKLLLGPWGPKLTNLEVCPI